MDRVGAVMRFRKKSKIQDFVVYVLIASDNNFEGDNNILIIR